MSFRGMFAAVACAFVFETTSTLRAQPVVDDQCFSAQYYSAERAILACTTVLHRGFDSSWERKAEAYYQRGSLYVKTGRDDLAVTDFAQAVSLQKNLWDAYYALADVFERHKRYDLEIQVFDRSLSENPKNSKSLNGRCRARALWDQKLDAALDDCDAAIAADAKKGGFLDSRALVEFRLGKYAESIADCTAALTSDPKLASSFYVRGLAKLKSNDIANGNADVAAAKALDPKIVETFEGYGIKP